jgi:hypothetical protein
MFFFRPLTTPGRNLVQKDENLDRINRIYKIFAPFPDGREQPSSAEGGEDSFVPASGRDKNIRSILLILSNKNMSFLN